MDTARKTVNVYDAKTHLSKLISEVETGSEITISRHGRPVARLVPYVKPDITRSPGSLAGRITIAEDFDAFTPEEAKDWYGE